MTKSNQFLAMLEDEAQAVLQCVFGLGISAEKRQLIAHMLLRRVQTRCAGYSLRLPRKHNAERERIRQAIATRYNGRNAQALADEYGISVRHVRRLSRKGAK